MLKESCVQSAGIGSVTLCCCICANDLVEESGRLRCTNGKCPGDFPVVNGVPHSNQRS